MRPDFLGKHLPWGVYVLDSARQVWLNGIHALTPSYAHPRGKKQFAGNTPTVRAHVPAMAACGTAYTCQIG